MATTKKILGIDVGVFQGLHNEFEELLIISPKSHKLFVENYVKGHPEKLTGLFTSMKKRSPKMVPMKKKKVGKVTKIDTIEELKEYLQIAMELELTVLFEYLFGCFSIINSSDEVEDLKFLDNLGPYYSEIRREYKAQLIDICLQEMKHFRLACDMLISIGGEPNFREVKFPSKYGIYDTSADLIRLNINALTMFTKNEEPASSTVVPQDQIKSFGSSDLEYISIDQLYSAMEMAFNKMGDSIFPEEIKFVPLHDQFTSANECISKIKLIRTEGEGGGLFFAFLKGFQDELKRALDVLPEKGKELAKKMFDLCDEIIEGVGSEEHTVKRLELLINLYTKYLKEGFPPFLNNPENLKLLYIEPSHWSRFLVMLMNYQMLYGQKYGDNENVDFPYDNEFSQIFSRPSYPRPKMNTQYKIETKSLIDISNLSFELLIKLFEALTISIPEELNKEYQIKQRYGSITYYPIMTVLIYPLGELLSYFQLSDDKSTPDENPKKSTAGFPFIVSDGNKITDPLEKFKDIKSTISTIYDASKHLDVFKNLNNVVGQWVEDPDMRAKVVQRVLTLIKNVQKTIRIIYYIFTNPVPDYHPSREYERQLPLNQPAMEFMDRFPIISETFSHEAQYYINMEFSGYVIFLLASDPDPTFDPRGFSGNMFVYEQVHDPDMTQQIYTQNPETNGKKFFSRDYFPKQKYDGVSITDVKLEIPDYLKHELNGNEILLNIEKSLKTDLIGKPFCFTELGKGDDVIYPGIPQLNLALTSKVCFDPINIVVGSNKIKLQRANFFVNPATNEIDPMITFEDACLKYSNSFDNSPKILIDRLPARLPDYKSVMPAGPSTADWIRCVTYRQNQMKLRMEEILKNYDDSEKYPFGSQVKYILDTFPSKLILYAFMFAIPYKDRNELSYLCSRFIQLGKVLYYLKKTGSFIADLLQYSYRVPLNSGKDFLKAEVSGDLSKVQIITDEIWPLEFAVNGMDYDSLTFLMKGSLKIPVKIPLK